MNTDILITILTQLGMMAGVLAAMFMFVMIQFKIQAQGKWYVELNDNGVLEYHLVKETSQSRVSAAGGAYIIPATPRMYTLWPMGLPRILQTEVRHEKYIKGEEEPIELKDVEKFTNTAQNVNRMMNMNLVKDFGDLLDDNSSLELILKRYAPWFVIAAFVLAATAGAAAYFGYTVNEEIGELQKTLASLVGEA